MVFAPDLSDLYMWDPGTGPYPRRVALAPRTPANERSTSGVGVCTPCGAVSIFPMSDCWCIEEMHWGTYTMTGKTTQTNEKLLSTERLVRVTSATNEDHQNVLYQYVVMPQQSRCVCLRNTRYSLCMARDSWFGAQHNVGLVRCETLTHPYGISGDTF